MFERGVSESKKPTRALISVSYASNEVGIYTQNVQRCRVAECRSDVVGDLVLWREVDLLEELRSNGNAASSSQSPQCGIRIMMVVVKVVFAIDRVTTGMVFLDIGVAIAVRHDDWVVRLK
jgi:hypothetical protein